MTPPYRRHPPVALWFSAAASSPASASAPSPPPAAGSLGSQGHTWSRAQSRPQGGAPTPGCCATPA
eukprot:scaffold1325_cov21-Tisochrysis_lutea.AAC.1